MNIKSDHLRGRTLSAAVLAFYLFLISLAAFPALHEIFHSDSHDSAHHCAVTLLTTGQVEPPGDQPVVLSPQFCFSLPLNEHTSPLSKAADLLPPTRAPPQISLC